MRARAISLATVLSAAPIFAADAVRLYEEKVRPLIEQQCQGCHGAAQKMSDLDLSTLEAMRKGGKRGPALVPGKPAESLLYTALSGSKELAMPPGRRLAGEEIEAIRAWIEGGAPVSTRASAEPKWGNYKDEDLWAFRPVKPEKPPIPGISPVDAFLLGKLSEKGLAPAPKADRRTLIRRVTLDLTGLPPTPDEVDTFLKDRAPDAAAFRKVVDRLLDSPQYGERWARHWLDVVRYADTNGYSNDFERPNAWRYRDYVIRSFQNDKPYNRFILEQVAGDELFPGDPEALIAVGFLRSGPWEHTGMSVAAETRQMWLDDVTHGTASTFLALTLGCARCHDHKFDPIPTRDYYRMQAVFSTTAFARRPVDFLPQERRDGFDEGKRQIEALIAQTKAKIDQYQQISNRRQLEKHGAKSFNDLPEEVRKKSALTPAEQEQVKLYRKHLSMYQLSADRYKPLTFSVSSGLRDDWNDISPGGERSYMSREDYEKAETRILTGGSLEAPAETVTPGVLSAVGKYSGLPAPAFPETIGGRRAALAEWIADRANPLTSRVMVNRIWQYHFGQGLAANASNFGKMGKKPSHPDLLDWLADYFVKQNWSVKAVHRAILLSEAYQRASEHPAHKTIAEKDPENVLLAYFPPRRLEAEALRDSMLALSGELSPAAGGPGTYPQINQDVAEQPRHAMGSLMPVYRPSPTKAARNRRSIYGFQQRSLVDPMVDVFNGPSMDLSCERRDSTTVPTQAFALFNSQVSYDLALAFAERLSRERQDPGGRIDRAYRLAFGRLPTSEEKRLVRQHLEEMTAFHRENPPPPRQERKPLVRGITSELTGENSRFEEQLPPWKYEQNVAASELQPEVRALADFALTLFNSNEFVFLY